MKTRRDFLKAASTIPFAGVLPTSALSPARKDDPGGEPIYAGKPMSFWLARLDNWDRKPELEVEFKDVDQTWVFVNFGQAAVPHLIEALRNESAYDAIVQLQFLASPETVRLLTEALKHRHPTVRAGAVQALLSIAMHRRLRPRVIEPLREALPEIAKAMQDENPAVVQGAEYIFHEFGPALDPTLPIPLDRLDDQDASSRREAVRRLRELRSRASEVVPLLKLKLRDPDASVRWTAAEALSCFDPDHPDIVPEFVHGAERVNGFETTPRRN